MILHVINNLEKEKGKKKKQKGKRLDQESN